MITFDENITFDYPDEMEQILTYLNQHGINLPPKLVEHCYRDYCDCTDAAGWMEVNEWRLSGFVNFLKEYKY